MRLTPNPKGFRSIYSLGGAAGYCLRVRKISMIPFYMLSYSFHNVSPIAANNKTTGVPIINCRDQADQLPHLITVI